MIRPAIFWLILNSPPLALPHYSPSKLNARMIDRETPYLKYVFRAAGNISDAYQLFITSATPVVSTGMAHVTRLAPSISAARHKTNLKLIPACCRDMYVDGVHQSVLHDDSYLYPRLPSIVLSFLRGPQACNWMSSPAALYGKTVLTISYAFSRVH